RPAAYDGAPGDSRFPRLAARRASSGAWPGRAARRDDARTRIDEDRPDNIRPLITLRSAVEADAAPDGVPARALHRAIENWRSLHWRPRSYSDCCSSAAAGVARLTGQHFSSMSTTASSSARDAPSAACTDIPLTTIAT